MRRRRGVTLAGLAAIMAIFAVHNVPDAATGEDRDYAERILAAAGYSGSKREFGDLTHFDSQIGAIAAVQDAVISIARLDEEIPFDHEREPRDTFEQKKGLCYDRSRAIEKMLTALGFETRHVSVYSTESRSTISALLTPRNDSHALSEVKTAKGWMAVDPNTRWMALTAEGMPLTVAGLRSIDLTRARWAGHDKVAPHPIFRKNYIFLRGLYSRHGRFYPPYTPLPDLNWRQLIENFSD